MRSSNPVFSRRGFSRDNGHAGFNAAPQAGGRAPRAPTRTRRARQPTRTPPNPYAQQDTLHGAPQAPARTGAMTIDDVVTRTGMTLGTVVAGRRVAWLCCPSTRPTSAVVRHRDRRRAWSRSSWRWSSPSSASPPPALILAYAAFEGVFLGVDQQHGQHLHQPRRGDAGGDGHHGVFAGVLIAYKMRWIRVTRRFYGFVMAAAIGFVLLMMVNLLFSVFGGGDGLGFRSGGLGILFGSRRHHPRRAASWPWTSSRSRTASPTAHRARSPGWRPSASP